jgi:two-component system chemotaxis response regulator CheY
MRILIVDDSPSLRAVIKGFILKVLPHAEIFEAGDGIMAEVVLQEGHVTDQPIEIIFLDWMMPRLSGRDFLTNIRNIEQFKKVPDIVMLTAETYPEQINSVVKYNVAAYVTKPFTVDDIANAIDKILKKRNLENKAS